MRIEPIQAALVEAAVLVDPFNFQSTSRSYSRLKPVE
jgi:hypothetical protein